MPNDSTTSWQVIEQWSDRAYFAGGVMFVAAAALNVVAMVGGSERLSLMVGEAFIAAGWSGGLIGLLGLYSGLANQNRWLSRAGVVFAIIGAVSFVVLAVASLVAYFQGSGVGDLPVPFIFLFPGLIVGSLLAFVTFGVASLRSEAYSRTVGNLLLAPPSIFLTNFFVLPIVLGTGPNPPEIIIVVTCVLALVMLVIGYVLRTNDQHVFSSEPTAEPASK